MVITTSYEVSLYKGNGLSKAYKATLDLYRCAVSWYIAVVQNYWNELEPLSYSTEKMKHIEIHTHKTKAHPVPDYDFDTCFPNMPVYFRRAVIMEAIGAYSSYLSNHDNWLASGKKGKEPQLGTVRNTYPTFYRGNMYEHDIAEDTAMLKLFNGTGWKWYSAKLKHTDMQYLRKHWYRHEKISPPTLEKHYGTYRLRFACSAKAELSDTALEDRKVCAVDLGINTDATCSIMTSDGTVLARKFINLASEKGHLYHELNELKKFQQRHGSHDVKNKWRYVRSLNEQLAYKTANAIADFAIEQSCDAIVFEYLDMKGKLHGSKKQKLAMWKKNAIQETCASIAHRHGIRVSHICAWGTSKLAYDGSGTTERSIDGNYSICRFKNGRTYNCDLSASYNVGSRYFIRELQKAMGESSWSYIKAKVPDAEKRTKCTLSTLWKINAACA